MAKTPNTHWQVGLEEQFASQEAWLREVNRNAKREFGALDGETYTPADELFISHSSRQADTQELKRRLICTLSAVKPDCSPGFTYWADFLDLAARGPVPWRKEVFEGVQSCAKFVAIIDSAYLQSYNCLQELYCAIVNNKPIVPLLIDDAGMRLITHTQGAKVTWDTPECQELRSHEGADIFNGHLFTEEILRQIYQHLSNINLCCCRKLDIEIMGEAACLRNAYQYVARDIPYLKEYAEINQRAMRWVGHAKRNSASLLLHGEDIP
eukprot:jgi/Tetstr1/437300/TSEL_002784.t1